VVWSLIQHAVLETHSQDGQDVVVDGLVALELLIGLEQANRVVRVALIDGRDAAELLVVPWILFTIRLDDFFYGMEKNYAI
jgi:uncharacterized protein (UPF0548 family)